MRHVPAAAAFLLATSASAGEGPYIEIVVTAVSTDTPGEEALTHARLVFDAGAPFDPDPLGLSIDAVEAELNISPPAEFGAANPFVDLSGALVLGDPSVSGSATLAYSFPGRVVLDVQLLRPNVIATETYTLEVELLGVASAAWEGIASLPDDPAAYRADTLVDVRFTISDVLGQTVRWHGFGDDPGFRDGTLSIVVRAIEPPTGSGGCNIADLAEPFDLLNFDDALAFLTAFGADCP